MDFLSGKENEKMGTPSPSLPELARDQDRLVLNNDSNASSSVSVSSASSNSSDAHYNGEDLACLSMDSCKSDDNGKVSGDTIYEAPEYVAGCFEGPEKTMEVQFRPGVSSNEQGLRSLSRAQLDIICTAAKCSILSHICSNHIDAYVLSESSLFVYKYKLVMKTCGTTTLLRCLSTILHFSDELGMQLTWLEYSRKNLFFPDAQQWPHSSFGDEIRFLDTHEKLQNRLKGSGYILGPVTGDHWFVYVADHDPNGTANVTATASSNSNANEVSRVVNGDGEIVQGIPSSHMLLTMPASPRNPIQQQVTQDRCINLMMFDMAPEVASLFFQSNVSSAKEMTVRSGINSLCPGAEIDEHSFSPCGYSMNAILHDAYSTIHVTPEPECSYVSFETNTCLKSYRAMVRNVINVFRPKRFVLTMFGDEADLKTMEEKPTDPKCIDLKGYGKYNRTSSANSNLNSEMVCYMANYALEHAGSGGTSSTGVTVSVGSSANVPTSNPPAVFPYGHRQPLPVEQRNRGYSLG
jgi:S-adenosylmethionine decarboxylase